MYSDIIYLFGDQFSTPAGMLSYKEELPTGTKVEQKKLSQMVVLGALLFLKEKKIIDIFIAEGKVLFVKTKTVKVKRLNTPKESVGGLEGALLRTVADEKNLQEMMHNLFSHDIYNPWGDVLEVVKKDLQEKGIIQKEEKGKVLFVKTYKNTLAKEISDKDTKELENFKSVLDEFKKNEELYRKTLSAIENGIASRQVRSNND
jgi:hypothetical protein